jgi:transcription elongation factor GreA
MELKEVKNRFQAILKTKDFNALEDFWLDLLAQPNINSQLTYLLDLIQPLFESNPDQGLLFLTILKENIKTTNDDAKTLFVLKAIARFIDAKSEIGDKVKLRKEIADCYRQLFKNCPNLAEFIRKSELLEGKPILSACEWLEKLIAFDVGNYVYSEDFGLGQVTEIDFLLDRLLVLFFDGKKSYFSFAQIKGLRPLSKDNFLVLKRIAPEVLRDKAKNDPKGLFQLLLQSVQKPLRVKEIKELLADIVNEADWAHFWEKTKRLVSNDPNILISNAPERTYAYSETKIEPKTVIKSGSKMVDEVITEEEVRMLNQDEIIGLCLKQKNFNSIKKLLKMIKANRTTDWLEIYSKLFFAHNDPRVLKLLAPDLASANVNFLKEVFDSYRSHPAQFLWLTRQERSMQYALGITAKNSLCQLLEILTNFDFRAYWSEARKCLKANDWSILKKALAEISAIEVQSVYKTIKNLPGLKDFEKIEIKHLIESALGETEAGNLTKTPDITEVIYSTAEGIKKREQELKELLTVAIPASAKEIGKAREFGDLSENYEYKAAKEKQARLVAKVEAIRSELRRAKPIDFAQVSTNVVGIGTKVTLVELVSGKTQVITILGPYDIDLEKGIISYLAPLAKDLLGKKVGDLVTIKSDSDNQQYQIHTIERGC